MNATAEAKSCPTSSIDPFSHEFLTDPYPFHHDLREAGPVVRLQKYGIWAVARYEDVHRTFHDWQTFCSSRGVGMSDFAKEKPWRPPSLVLEKDPPEHERARRVLSKVLSPVVMKTLRDGFVRAAAAKADELVERREFDAISDLAQAFPLSVFPDAVGMRQEGREHLLPYAGTVFNAFGPDNELRRQAIERAAPHVQWVTEQCQRANLAPDGIGAKIHDAADAGEITHEEAPLLVRSLLSAGLDTTVNGFGAAIYCVARFPDQWSKLRKSPGLARGAFEEAIRFESPVQTFFRTTTRAVSIGDVELGEGEKILMLLASANRDPRKWDRPDEYDIERRVSGHVGFGSGIHMCVGQLLARLEAEVFLTELAKRVNTIEMTGEPTRAYNNTLRGLDRLPVRITPN
ncbi:cytochrome P450 [Tardiphaga sp.]|jgi:cytochrome P450|uniref:cytochrome P450 n=1 Tax=Tardiphaga sp. TaxID=1926292 RepID=UPI0037D9B373